MNQIGKVLIVLGFAVTIWAGYQYISNEQSPIRSQPQNITEGLKTLTDLYSNVFEKAEKQSQAKDIGVIGIITIISGAGLIFFSRKKIK